MAESLPAHKTKCYYCGRLTLADKKAGCAMRTRDHTTPNSLGGKRVVICCEGCNHIKAATPYKVFMFFIAEYKHEFATMSIDTREALRKKYSVFVHDLTLAGFTSARALAINEKKKSELLRKGFVNARFH
jgi:hypothetical protein